MERYWPWCQISQSISPNHPGFISHTSSKLFIFIDPLHCSYLLRRRVQKIFCGHNDCISVFLEAYQVKAGSKLKRGPIVGGVANGRLKGGVSTGGPYATENKPTFKMNMPKSQSTLKLTRHRVHSTTSS